ncbi:MAG: HEAT repeat domain-containing protein [Desulfomonile sp.]|nr:HEAT repeat domain-containing protein [Desulfomonile sp.]
MQDPDWRVRRASAEGLGFFSSASSRIIRPLVTALGDEKIEVRREVVLSLGRLGPSSPEVKEALQRRAEETDPLMKTNVEIALALLGTYDDSTPPHLVKALGSDHQSTASGARLALSRIARESPEKIISVLSEALEVREQQLLDNALKVLQSLKGRGEHLLPQIAGLYDKVGPQLRRRVLWTVIDIDTKGDHALPLCLKALDDSEAFVRKEALMALVRYRPRLDSYSDQLIKALQDRNEDNRLIAIGVIKGLPNRAADAIPSLISLAESGPQRTRIAAISALGSIKASSQESFAALGKALVDKDEKIRVAAVNALRVAGTSASQPAIEILEGALAREPEQRMRGLITAALDELRKGGQGHSTGWKEKRRGG